MKTKIINVAIITASIVVLLIFTKFNLKEVSYVAIALIIPLLLFDKFVLRTDMKIMYKLIICTLSIFILHNILHLFYQKSNALILLVGLIIGNIIGLELKKKTDRK